MRRNAQPGTNTFSPVRRMPRLVFSAVDDSAPGRARRDQRGDRETLAYQLGVGKHMGLLLTEMPD